MGPLFQIWLSGRHRIINSLAPDLARRVFHCICGENHLPFIAAFNGSADCLYYSAVVNQGMQWYLDERLRNNDPRLRSTDDLTTCFADRVVSLIVIGEYRALARINLLLAQQFGERLECHLQENFYSPGWFWLTIQDSRATKERAIRSLVEILGFQDRQLVVFGDHSNDLTMFQIAHRSVAVANAIAEVKNMATEIAASNEDDGVLRYIENDWSNGLF